MKIKKLTVKNIGPIADAVIEIDKPLLVFYGEIRQGKTTLLNAVRWVCGGAFPADIIRHGAAEASIELDIEGGLIGRSWYRTKATEGKPSEIKARAVQFVRNGRPVPEPASELKRLLNPFLLNQDHFRVMTELERKKYLSDLFAVDTADLDTELFENQRKASELRAKLTGYGEMDLTEVKPVDTKLLRDALADKRAKHEEACRKVEEGNKAIRETNLKFDIEVSKSQRQKADIEELRQRLNTLEGELAASLMFQKDHPKQAEQSIPEKPDTSELESKLQSAAAQNVRAGQYQANLKRDQARRKDETALKALEDRGRTIKKEKIGRLSKVNETCGVSGLAFAEDGQFSFEGTAAGMLSTSQIMRLSSALSALYPEGLGVELLDRGESLGRSIFDYVKHAESKKVSVLATVVGQRPAQIPDNVGVFVVKDGVVIPDTDT